MKRVLLISCTLLFATAVARSQMPMPQPAPEHKKLDYFAGKWTSSGDMKPGPMGPGGKMTMQEDCKWMNGNFFVVCHSEYSAGSMGNGSGVAVMGYNAETKTYTYDEYNSMGEAEHSKGTLDGDTWTWTGDDKMGGQIIHGKFTMKVTSPTSYTFKYEVSTDGTSWATVMEGQSNKS